MATFKSLTIVAVLLVGETSLAVAQNGLPTGGQSPVAGGANGGQGGWYAGSAYGYPAYRFEYYPYQANRRIAASVKAAIHHTGVTTTVSKELASIVVPFVLQRFDGR